MNVRNNLAYFAVGLLFSIGFLVSAFFIGGFDRVVALSITACFSLPLAIGGAYGLLKGTPEDESNHLKNRATASVLSMIPGMGHLYLDRNRKGLLFLFGLVASAVVLLLGTVLWEDNYGYVSGTANILFIYGALSFMTVWIWSILDVARLCNEAGLESVEAYYEVNLKRTDAVLSIALLSMFALFILSSAFMIHYGATADPRINIAIMVLSCLMPLYVFLNYMIRKRNNTWQLH